jgi:hypothetical protein
MLLNRKEDAVDGVTWKCNNVTSIRKQKKKPCGTRISVRDGTWASLSRLTIPEIIQHNFLLYSKYVIEFSFVWLTSDTYFIC